MVKETQTSMSSKTTDELDDICPVCREHTTIYATGVCDHHICFKCSTRMRVLCGQMYCAICRGELPKVVFTSKAHKFGAVETHHYPVNRKYKIYFENNATQDLFYQLQQHRCAICHDRSPFHNFSQYKDHMRKEHQLFLCDLCVDHIKLFSHERKFYDRKRLGEHRRVGDKDDRSHKGHPICVFCDVRYFHKDELVRHLRKDHFFCHFCEADGIANEFYPNHEEMARHFRNQHFLCEEGDCEQEKFFTNAFRTDIDLKAHRATSHSRNMSRALAKATRTIDVEVNLPPRPSGRGRARGVVGREDYEDMSERRGGGRGHRGGGRGGAYDRRKQREEEQVQRAVTASLNQELSRQGHVSVLNPDLIVPANITVENMASEYAGNSKQDFPAMDSASNSADHSPCDSDTERPPKQEQQRGTDTLAKQLARSSNMSVQDGSMEVEDFPMLGGGRGTAKHVSSSTWSGLRPDDFPGLSGSGSNTPSTRSPKPSRSWVATAPAQSRQAALPSSRTPAIQSNADFPSLGSISSMLMTAKQPSDKQRAPPPPPPPQQLLSTPSFLHSSQASAKPSSHWQTVGNKPEPTPLKAKKSKAKATKKPQKPDIQEVEKAKTQEVKKAGTEGVKKAASTERVEKHDAEDFPDLGRPALPVQSSAQHLFGASQARPKSGSKPSAAKGRVVDIIPAPRKAEVETQPPAAKPFKVVEWQQVTGGNNAVSMIEVKEPPKPAIEVVIKSNTKEKSRKKKEARPSAASKHEDFPVLESSQQSSSSSAAAVTVGNTWMSDELIKSIEKSEEWKEIPKSKPTPGSNASKKKAKKTVSVIDDDDFPSLGAAPATAAAATWLASGKQSNQPQSSSNSSSNSSSRQEEQEPGIVKMKVKGKKKGKKSPDNDIEDKKENSNGIDNRNAAAEALIKQIADIESGQLDSMSVNKENGAALNNFPSLHSSSQPPLLDNLPSVGKSAPPPGFCRAPGIKAPPPGMKAPPPGIKAPPPGFAQKKAPPPGFSSPHDITNNNTRVDSTAAATEFIKPTNFQSRNQALIACIKSLLEDDAKFDLFKTLSGDFRCGMVSAATYFSRCCDIMTAEKFLRVFAELLVLLPDISKQKQLLVAYTAHGKQQQGSSSQFTLCDICSQVIYSTDVLQHGEAHADATDFPALAASTGKGMFNMGTWGGR